MFLRFDPAKLDPEWLAALGWIVGGRAILKSAEPGCELLQLSSHTPILPDQTVMITARPWLPLRPRRVLISRAADWIVNDIKVGNRSQFRQSGDIPGVMFATHAIDRYISFETVQTAMDLVMTVTYIGLEESGVPFFAWVVGTTVPDPRQPLVPRRPSAHE